MRLEQDIVFCTFPEALQKGGYGGKRRGQVIMILVFFFGEILF